MWRMRDGDRVFTETEWALFQAGLELLRDSIEEDISAQTDHAQTEVAVFDRLTPEQKLALVADVCRALRDRDVATPRHTAANEAAIMAVFSMVRVELEMELDAGQMATDDSPVPIRRLLRAACDGTEDREEPLPDPNSMNADDWDGLLEEVEGRIFWDYDFEMADEFLDLPPDEARAQLQVLGIDPDYYLAVPAEPDEAGLTVARQTLARLLGRPGPND